MAELVVAQHAEGGGEGSDLPVPQLERRPDRVRADERRCVLRPVQPVVQPHPSSSRYRASAWSTKSSASPTYSSSRLGQTALDERVALGEQRFGHVLPHALRADLEGVEALVGRRGGSAGERERGGQCGPLRLPGACGTLVLVVTRRQQAGVRVHDPRARAGKHRARRILLVRHRRGAAAGALCDLGHLRLGEQDDVETDLPARAPARRRARRRARRPARGAHATAAPIPRDRAALRAGAARPGPAAPRAASVPPAPPSCAGSATAASLRRASTTATSQPAAFSPNVVGTACWSSVRAAIGVARCASASSAQAAATPSSSSRIKVRASRATSIAAVSTMSWLVAPKWTKPAASPPTCSRRARTSGSAGLPTDRPSAAIRSTSKSSARQARRSPPPPLPGGAPPRPPRPPVRARRPACPAATQRRRRRPGSGPDTNNPRANVIA